MSQPPTTRSSVFASGTKSLIAGVRPSVRFPKRTVPNWVREPMGFPKPRFMASKPAIKVVVTAPMPGIKTPNLPSAGAIWTASRLAKFVLLVPEIDIIPASMRERATSAMTTIVVDDESLARDELVFLLRDFPEVEVRAAGSNGLEALELIQKLTPDVVFLDVHMPGLDGMGVVRRLREMGLDLPRFIFVTAYDQYGPDPPGQN